MTHTLNYGDIVKTKRGGKGIGPLTCRSYKKDEVYQVWNWSEEDRMCWVLDCDMDLNTIGSSTI